MKPLSLLSSLFFLLCSTPTLISQSLIDSTSKIYITEIMYDPASSSTTVWEYVEIYNADSIAYDLTGSILDDAAGAILNVPNILHGIIEPYSTAVLFNDDNDIETLQAAWDTSIHFIPVSDWGILNNNGDRVGFWANLEAYNNRDYMTSLTDVFYDGGDLWPVHDGMGAIELNCEILPCDLNNPQHWHLNNGSMFSQPAGNNLAINRGSPGVFPNPAPLIFANRFEFLPAPLDTGMVEVLFGLRVCATDGTNIQRTYDKNIILIDSFSTADYSLVSSDVLTPVDGCVNFMISPTSAGKIKLAIGNEDFTNLQTVIVIEPRPNVTIAVPEVEKFKVYPTVVRDFLTLAFSEAVSDDMLLRIFDIQGKLVQKVWVERGVLVKMVAVSGLNGGWFLIQTENELDWFFKT